MTIMLEVNTDSMEFKADQTDTASESGTWKVYLPGGLVANIYIRRDRMTQDLLWISVTFLEIVPGDGLRYVQEIGEPFELTIKRWVQRDERYGFLNMFTKQVYRIQKWDTDTEEWYWFDDPTHFTGQPD